MSGVQDGLEFDPDRVPVRGAADTREAPSFFHFDWDATKASAEQAYYDVPGRAAELRGGEMAAAAAELARLNGKRASDYYLTMPGEPMGAPQVDENGFWRDLAEVRRTRPDALKDFGADQADYDKRRVGALQAGRANREQRMAQGGMAGNLLGGAAGGLSDPINLITMPFGGGETRTMAGAIVRSGLVNAGVETAEQPLLAVERGQQGSELTLGEAATNIGSAFVGGAGLHAAGEAAGKGLELGARGAAKLYDRAVPLDYRMAQALKQSVGGDWLLTPEQAAAVHVVERAGEIDATNPFPETYGGLNAHAAKIQQVLGDMAELPHASSDLVAAPAAAASVRSQALSSAAPIDAYLARARGVESGGNDLARNPGSSATGRYQFTKDTWLRTYKARFGTGISDTAILAKRGDGTLQDQLMRDLTAGNAASLQRAGIPVTEGNLYLAHFAGEAGARKLHAAEPGASAEAVLGAKVVEANPFLRGKSAGEVIAWADRKMGGTGDVVPAGVRIDAPESADVPAVLDPAADTARPLAEIDADRSPVSSAGEDHSWADMQAGMDRYQRSVGDLWTKGPAELEDLHARAVAEEGEQLRSGLAQSGLPEAVSAPIGRMIDAGAVERAGDRLMAALDEHFAGDIPPELERLVAPTWADHVEGGLPNASDVEHVLRAHANIFPSDDVHAIGSEMGWAFRKLHEGDLRKIADGLGSAEQQAALVTIKQGYDALQGKSLSGDQIPQIMHDAMIENGVNPLNAAELSDSIVSALRGERPATAPATRPEPAALPAPAQRDLAEAEGSAGPVIADPATGKAFDDPAGEGVKVATDSTWHDLRAEFADDFAGAARFDLDDGKGARTVAEIDGELAAREQGIAAIKGCMT